MEKATQQNASTAEESAASSEELSAQAQTMNNIVQQLASLVQGSGNQPHSQYDGSAYKSFVQRQRPKQGKSGAAPKKSPKAFTVNAPENTRTGTHIVNPEDIIPFDKERDDF